MKFALEEQFGTDAELERDGAEFSPAPGVTFLVRSQTAPKVRNRILSIAKRQRPLYAAGGTPKTEQLDAQELDIVEVLIASWRGVTDGEGAAVSCTPESIRALMTSVPRLRRAVLDFSNDADAFRRAGQDAVAGN